VAKASERLSLSTAAEAARRAAGSFSGTRLDRDPMAGINAYLTFEQQNTSQG
jgi:hypothetical protein